MREWLVVDQFGARALPAAMVALIAHSAHQLARIATIRRQPYYEKCEASSDPSSDHPCCDSCESGRAGFCSPHSGNCYEKQAKPYYKSCPNGGLARPERRLSAAPSKAGSIRFMSYNLFGWNAFNQNKWKSEHILGKVRDWHPAVLGAQEVETGGGHGGDIVSEEVVSKTGLSGGVGGSQFYDKTLLEAQEWKSFDLVRGYWMSMTKYLHKASNVSFLFFNSHWKHGYGAEQKVIIAEAIHAERLKYGSPPTILVGDTNQFCLAHEREAIRYLKGEEGSSPVTFVDAIAHDKGMSYDGGCRVDFILASAGQWQLVESHIDRDGMGGRGIASDHAALMAELVPIAEPDSVES
eukprot:TRINITY_DN9241_c0_g1_i2.p1 TRINITY_DN9241_c0_g1~~TRINITY_DN9241_c0_g1_i2.p1  ORF type:complete len:351 (+),score=36.26 TRINITY_DN9241_c0_g1_i2:240-1292(+)